MASSAETTPPSSLMTAGTVRHCRAPNDSADSVWQSYIGQGLAVLEDDEKHDSPTRTVTKSRFVEDCSPDSPNESYKSAFSRLKHSPRAATGLTQACHETTQKPHNVTDPQHQPELEYAIMNRQSLSAPPFLDDDDKANTLTRWLSTLRRRKQKRVPVVTSTAERWTLDDFEPCRSSAEMIRPPRRRNKSNSWTSSSGILATVRSATITVATASIAPMSRRTSKRVNKLRKRSIASIAEPRSSLDTPRAMMDEAARKRSRRRRDKVEELIRSEESYVADLKALLNIYATVLGHQESRNSFIRASSQKTLVEMLHLHDELLGQLLRAVPFAEFDQTTARVNKSPRGASHARWHSIDLMPSSVPRMQTTLATIRQGRRSLSISRSIDREPIVLHCSPQVVGDVGIVFLRLMPRLHIYDDFGARYGMIKRDFDETHSTISSWHEYERAIEALSTTLNSVRSRDANQRKALTFRDLLIKPIQRLPRYELLFAELSHFTPVCDDPNTHALIEDVRLQLSETCRSMNDARDNPELARSLESTWLLSHRLSFADQISPRIFMQLLGDVVLCGCLHIAFRGKSNMRGSYMICIMFSTTLLLANIVQEDPLRYGVLAGISLATILIEECDNGRGLQCHTAPHS